MTGVRIAGCNLRDWIRPREMVRGWWRQRLRAATLKYLYALLLAFASTALHSARAEIPSFDAFYNGVAHCSLDLSHYADMPMNPYAEAVVINLPNAGSVRGFLITSFYFSPARDGHGEGYGLIFNAPFEAVVDAFPELTARETMNGYLRRLLRLSEETSDKAAQRQTLLVCNGGTQT
ncbi:MAG: hypothetical protein ABI612_00600 [Betaproteobacteria bacterium]